MFGCSPDYNDYSKEQNIVERNSQTLRSARAHLHVSYDGLTVDKAINLIKLLDLFISVPLVVIEPDSERKQLYGKAGAYRVKTLKDDTVIVEYRSPSNFWLTSDETMKFVFEQIVSAIDYQETYDGKVTSPMDIITAINTNDVDRANEIIEDYNIEIPKELMPEGTKEPVPYNYENDSLGG